MEELYEEWVVRKINQMPVELSRPWTMSREWEKITGGRIMSAELTLTARPSESFSYTEKCIWPEDNPAFRNCVLDGILDAILVDLACSPNRMSFTLEAIKWREGKSVPRAYYRAARELVGEIFTAEEKLKLEH